MRQTTRAPQHRGPETIGQALTDLDWRELPAWRRRALTPELEGATMLVARDLTGYIITRKGR